MLFLKVRFAVALPLYQDHYQYWICLQMRAGASNLRITLMSLIDCILFNRFLYTTLRVSTRVPMRSRSQRSRPDPPAPKLFYSTYDCMPFRIEPRSSNFRQAQSIYAKQDVSEFFKSCSFSSQALIDQEFPKWRYQFMFSKYISLRAFNFSILNFLLGIESHTSRNSFSASQKLYVR